MATKFRKSPPVCLFISLFRLLIGKLRCSGHYSGCVVKMLDSSEFIIFRHISVYPVGKVEHATTFIVRFKFARLSHKANKIASIIPMLLITGYPGFQTKIYAVNKENGFWQGMYQWKSMKHLEDYKKSFVYRMMNKRAISDSLQEYEYENQHLTEFIDKNKMH